MRAPRRMTIVWLTAGIGVAALTIAAVALAGQPPEPAAPQSEVAILEGDVGVLWTLQQLRATKDQCDAAAKALDDYAAIQEQSRAMVESLLAGSENLLRSAREKLVMGEQPDADSLAALLKLRQEVRKARAEGVRARLTVSEALASLLTDEQKQKLADGLLSRAPGAGRRAGGPADALRIIRQWSDQEFADKGEALAKRFAGKDAAADKLAEVKALLSEVREMSAEEFDVKVEQLSQRLVDMSGAEGNAAGKAGAAGLLGAQRPLLGPIAVLRQMPQEKYDRSKAAILDWLQGANAAADEGAKTRLGDLLDEIRQVPEAELRAKLPDLGRRLAEAAQAAGVDLSKLGSRPLAGMAAGAEGKDRPRVGMEFVTMVMSQNPRHVAELLREYAGNIVDGR